MFLSATLYMWLCCLSIYAGLHLFTVAANQVGLGATFPVEVLAQARWTLLGILIAMPVARLGLAKRYDREAGPLNLGGAGMLRLLGVAMLYIPASRLPARALFKLFQTNAVSAVGVALAAIVVSHLIAYLALRRHYRRADLI
jgi:hypothetical protein